MSISQQLKKVVPIAPEINVIIHEMLGVVAGTKPVFITILNGKKIKLIMHEFPELKIEQIKGTIIGNSQQTVCALSKERHIAEEAIRFFMAEKNMGKSGEFLGYPKCCVQSHLFFVRQNIQYQHPKVVYRSHKNSKKHNFLTNNLFNFTSRLQTKEDLKKQKQYFSLNKDFPIPLYYLQFISHIPCSYDCKDSIKIGKDTYDLLKEYASDIEKIVTFTLSKPVLFFDIFEWVIFDGYVKKNILFYKKIISPISLIDTSLLDKIKEGNKISVNNKKIKIFKNDSLVYSYLQKDETDGFILDFKKNS